MEPKCDAVQTTKKKHSDCNIGCRWRLETQKDKTVADGASCRGSESYQSFFVTMKDRGSVCSAWSTGMG